MFIVLNKSACLFKVIACEVISQVVYLFLDNRNTITANNYSFHFNRTDLIIPIMVSDIANLKPFTWISLQNLLNQVFILWRDELRNSKITSQDFLIQFICVWVFKRQVSTSHRVQNNTTRPDITTQAMVTLARNHLRRSITRRPTRSLKRLPRRISIRKTKINNLDIIEVIEQQILRFQISMADSTLMNILNT